VKFTLLPPQGEKIGRLWKIKKETLAFPNSETQLTPAKYEAEVTGLFRIKL
jgi:hypothetical protein